MHLHTSRTSQVITIVSGSISILSSFLILYVILRSRNRLTSPYHQIMFSIGFWDIIYSLAMALTTAPMPSEGVTKDFYNFTGKIYGSTATCDAQGFLYILGASFSISSCCTLYTYFSATIRFGINEQTVKRRLLPLFFFLACIISIPAPVYFLVTGNINPSPLDPFCSFNAFPLYCKNPNENDPFEDEDVEQREECIRGDQDSLMIGAYYSIIGLGLATFSVVLNMGLICHSVYANTLALKKSLKLKKNNKNASCCSRTAEVTTGGQRTGLPTSAKKESGVFIDIDLGRDMDKTLQHSTDNPKTDTPDTLQEVSPQADPLQTHPLALTPGNTGDDKPNINANGLTRDDEGGGDLAVQHHEEEEEEERLAKFLSLRKVIVIQAFMYIAAFLLCWTTLIINVIINFHEQEFSETRIRARLRLVLQPLQGFFNALIFIVNKAYDFKQATGVDWLKAFSAVFKTPKEIPEIHFSNVSQVAMDQFYGNLRSDGTNLDNLVLSNTRISDGADNRSPNPRIRCKGMNLDAHVSWDDISSNNSNGVNSAAQSNSMPSRFNLPSFSGLSGFSFSQQSRSRCQSIAEGLSLGPSRSIEVSGKYGDREYEHSMQMSDNDDWVGDDAGLSYA